MIIHGFSLALLLCAHPARAAAPVPVDAIATIDARVARVMDQLKVDKKFAFLFHDNQGLAALVKGDIALASAHFERAARLRPDFADAHDHLGLARELSGDLQGALSEYTKGLQADPTNMAHYTTARGAVYSGLGRNEEALKDFDRALTERPADPSLLRHRSFALAGLGRFAEAGKDYQRAIDLRPQVKNPKDKLFCERLSQAGISIAACL